MTPTCGRDDCTSPCHTNTVGRYCAPLRCYCGQCPSFEPLRDLPTPTPTNTQQRASSWDDRDHDTWMDKL